MLDTLFSYVLGIVVGLGGLAALWISWIIITGGKI